MGDTTTARGLLMLSPRPMPTMVIIMDTDSPTTGTVMPITVTTATLMPTITDTTTDMLHTVMLTGVTTATLTLITDTTDTDIITKLFCYFVQELRSSLCEMGCS